MEESLHDYENALEEKNSVAVSEFKEELLYKKELEDKKREQLFNEKLEKLNDEFYHRNSKEWIEFNNRCKTKENFLKKQYENNKILIDKKYNKQFKELPEATISIHAKKSIENNKEEILTSISNNNKEEVKKLIKEISLDEVGMKADLETELDREMNEYKFKITQEIEALNEQNIKAKNLNKSIIENEIKNIQSDCNTFNEKIMMKQIELQELKIRYDDLKGEYDDMELVQKPNLNDRLKIGVKKYNPENDLEVIELRKKLKELEEKKIDTSQFVVEQSGSYSSIFMKDLVDEIKGLKLAVNRLSKESIKRDNYVSKSKMNEEEERVPLNGKMKEISLFVKLEKSELIKKREELAANFELLKTMAKSTNDFRGRYNDVSLNLIKLR